MVEYLKCTRCRAILWDEIDSLGRLYFTHPNSPCVEAPPTYYHDCDICHEVEVRLESPYRGGRQLVICSNTCLAMYERRRKIARRAYDTKYRANRNRVRSKNRERIDGAEGEV